MLVPCDRTAPNNADFKFFAHILTPSLNKDRFSYMHSTLLGFSFQGKIFIIF